jgi:hypothetical protein
MQNDHETIGGFSQIYYLDWGKGIISGIGLRHMSHIKNFNTNAVCLGYEGDE